MTGSNEIPYALKVTSTPLNNIGFMRRGVLGLYNMASY